MTPVCPTTLATGATATSGLVLSAIGVSIWPLVPTPTLAIVLAAVERVITLVVTVEVFNLPVSQ